MHTQTESFACTCAFKRAYPLLRSLLLPVLVFRCTNTSSTLFNSSRINIARHSLIFVRHFVGTIASCRFGFDVQHTHTFKPNTNHTLAQFDVSFCVCSISNSTSRSHDFVPTTESIYACECSATISVSRWTMRMFVRERTSASIAFVKMCETNGM